MPKAGFIQVFQTQLCKLLLLGSVLKIGHWSHARTGLLQLSYAHLGNAYLRLELALSSDHQAVSGSQRGQVQQLPARLQAVNGRPCDLTTWHWTV